MSSDLAISALQILLLSGSVVWILRKDRTKLLLTLVPVAVVLFSTWWLVRPGPRDGPAWVIPVFVTFFTLGTVWIAKLARTERPGAHFVVTVLGGVLFTLVSGPLAYMVWGLAGIF